MSSSIYTINYKNKLFIIKTFLLWAYPQMNSLDISWLNINQL